MAGLLTGDALSVLRRGPGAPVGSMRRCAAVAIDLPIALLLLLVPLIALDQALVGLSVPDDLTRLVWRASAAWALAVVLSYSPLCVSRWGGTPGKRVVGIEVVRAGGDGARIGYWTAVLRHVVNLVLTTVTVLLVAHATVMALDPNHRGLHDRLVSSAVVRRRART